MNFELEFMESCTKMSDINEHLPTIRKHAEECDIVVELGVRYVVSTWALVAAKPKRLISVDIKHPSEFGASDVIDKVSVACAEQGTQFEFVLGDSRKVELPEHDLLFIDTLHDYEVLKEELANQSAKTRKYIIFHDTTTFGNRNESGGGKGLNPAISEFLSVNPKWSVKHVFTNNNGLTVLQKDL